MSRKKNWTSDLWSRLGEETLNLYLQEPEIHLVTLARMAQERAIPREQQRAISTMQQIAPVVEHMRNRLAEIRKANPSGEEAERLAEARHDAFLHSLTVEEVFGRFGVAKLIGEAARRMAEAVLDRDDRAELQTDSPVPEPEHEPVMPASAPTRRKPRAVIIGLKGDQILRVKEALPAVDVTHYKAGSKARYLKTADHYWLMTKFIKHHDEDRLRNVVTLDRITRFGGGVTQLVNNVRQRLVNAPSRVSA